MTPQQTISQLLNAHAAEGAAMRDDEVQAYLTAWVSGPDSIADHLPQISADIIGDAPLNDENKARVVQAVAEWAEELRQAWAQKQPPALLLHEYDNGEPDYFSWCNAYLYALDTTPTDWFAAIDDEEFEDLFYPLMALGGIYEEDDVLPDLDDNEIRSLQDEVPHAVRNIHAYWHAVKNKPQTVRREGAKTGRNDPCPCGSGKKYKACCGRN